MPVNLSVKNVPEALASKLRERAERNHRSLQGEMMAILETAVEDPQVLRANASAAAYAVTPALADSLLETLAQIASERKQVGAKSHPLASAHDRKSLRKSSV